MAPLFPQRSSFSDNDGEVTTNGRKKISRDEESYNPESSADDIEAPPEVCHKSDDAFLYYSNDEIRIKTLKLQEVDTATNAKPSRQERKTRISFELDPMLILEDELDAMEDDEEEDFDIDFSHLKTGNKNSKMDLLAGLLQI